MMTSNVFGHLAAQNVGYAKVELQQSLARGIKGVVRDLSSARFRIRRDEVVFPNRQLIHDR